MVPAIIENEHAAGGAQCIRFHVYPRPRRPGVILGGWQHAGESVDPKGPPPIDHSRLGTSVEIEFQRAVTVANQDGVPFVWVDDPNGLFPPSARPSFRRAPGSARLVAGWPRAPKPSPQS